METNTQLHKIFDTKSLRVGLFALSFSIAFINVVLTSSRHFGLWDFISYLLILSPLAWVLIHEEGVNRYTKWFLPVVAIWLGDIFYFNNDFVQFFLSPILFILIVILYLTSTQQVSSFYQTLIPRLAIPITPIRYLEYYLSDTLAYEAHKSLYSRVFLALLVTLPFVVLFLSLFMSADENFDHFILNLSLFDGSFEYSSILWIAVELFGFLLLYIYGFSNVMIRGSFVEHKTFDPLIVGIFLGMLNLLFVTFLLFQLSYLFGGEGYIKASGINIAQFAREGFFQLMWTMGIVATILLVIMSRYHGERTTAWLLGGLLISTIIIGFASLKKMHLYQSLKGATVLRYYVEWFDYFLIAVLMVGVVFILRRIPFARLLDTVSIIAMVSLTLVSSLNIDEMVASHNIEKFKESPKELDKVALSRLSIDALPPLQGSDIKINHKFYEKRNCDKMEDYHLGYCMKLAKYGNENINYIEEYE